MAYKTLLYSTQYTALVYANPYTGIGGYNIDIARSPQQLGAILRRYRKKGALTQTDVAARTQLRQATISALENGEAGTQLRTLAEVLAALDLELVVQPRRKSSPSDIEDLI